MKTRLTIQDLVPAYARIGIPAAHAVKYIIESRMRGGLSGGHGNRAKRRLSVTQKLNHESHELS